MKAMKVQTIRTTTYAFENFSDMIRFLTQCPNGVVRKIEYSERKVRKGNKRRFINGSLTTWLQNGKRTANLHMSYPITPNGNEYCMDVSLEDFFAKGFVQTERAQFDYVPLDCKPLDANFAKLFCTCDFTGIETTCNTWNCR